jgi:hypothetical protein
MSSFLCSFDRRSMMRTQSVLWRASWPLAALVTSLVVGPRSAEAFQELNIEFPVSFTIPNPCNGEDVDVSGVFHDRISFVFNNGGQLLLVEHVNAQGVTGEGDLGNTYQVQNTANTIFNGVFTGEDTVVRNLRLVSDGSAPNFEVHLLEHITVNANGTVTADFEDFTAECH